ncbi:hypothetical protein ACFX1X_022244 [Malus domestica]
MVDKTSYCEKQVNKQHYSSQLPVVTFQHTASIAVAASKPATTLQPSSLNSPLVGGSARQDFVCICLMLLPNITYLLVGEVWALRQGQKTRCVSIINAKNQT